MLVAFLIGRYMFRDYLYERANQNKYFHGINKAVKNKGAYIVFLLRCSFFFPYPAISYSLSITDLSIKKYMIGNNGLAIVSIVYIYIGATT